ncbi:HAD family phosphatase [Streptomyces pathocidini]|uniref:HAD family hydrolase n=1 Tax=Streptomyces pathocidini TaxID=1650571 RepID=UPI0033D8F094
MTRDATRSELPSGDTGATMTLRRLIAGTRCVLFDFDGPICRLFAAHPSAGIAQRLKGWLTDQGHRTLVAALAGTADPQDVLRAVGAAHPGSELVRALEHRLTEEEELATAGARPTPYADPLIRTLVAVERQVAVTTNNSPRAATRYLASRGLSDCFGPHIHGRTDDPALLKPHPDCLTRALRSLGHPPQESLMIGDTRADAVAARSAGAQFLGYAHDERREDALYAAGASLVVDSLEPVLEAARAEATR